LALREKTVGLELLGNFRYALLIMSSIRIDAFEGDESLFI